MWENSPPFPTATVHDFYLVDRHEQRAGSVRDKVSLVSTQDTMYSSPYRANTNTPTVETPGSGHAPTAWKGATLWKVENIVSVWGWDHDWLFTEGICLWKVSATGGLTVIFYWCEQKEKYVARKIVRFQTTVEPTGLNPCIFIWMPILTAL